MPKDIFSDLGKLEVLQIGGNPFTTINSTSFTTLTSLKSLDISRCPHLNVSCCYFFSSFSHFSLFYLSNHLLFHLIQLTDDSNSFNCCSIVCIVITWNNFLCSLWSFYSSINHHQQSTSTLFLSIDYFSFFSSLMN